MENSEQIYEVTLPNGMVIKSKEVYKPSKEELQKLGFRYLNEINDLISKLYFFDPGYPNNKDFEKWFEEVNRTFNKCIGLAYDMGVAGYPRKITDEENFSFAEPNRI